MVSFAEARTLLSRVAVYDNRSVDAASVTMWAEVLEPFTLAECMWALKEFARISVGEYLQLGHIVRIVREHRHEYFNSHPRGVARPDEWLDFEQAKEIAARNVAAIRAMGVRSAVEAIDAITDADLATIVIPELPEGF